MLTKQIPRHNLSLNHQSNTPTTYLIILSAVTLASQHPIPIHHLASSFLYSFSFPDHLIFRARSTPNLHPFGSPSPQIIVLSPPETSCHSQTCTIHSGIDLLLKITRMPSRKAPKHQSICHGYSSWLTPIQTSILVLVSQQLPPASGSRQLIS